MTDLKKEVVGLESINYENRNGRHVEGVRIYCVEPLMAPHVGSRAFDVYVSGGHIPDYHLGPYVTLLYEPSYNGSFKCTGVLYENK